jgi:hypothetical protein
MQFTSPPGQLNNVKVGSGGQDSEASTSLVAVAHAIKDLILGGNFQIVGGGGGGSRSGGQGGGGGGGACPFPVSMPVSEAECYQDTGVALGQVRVSAQKSSSESARKSLSSLGNQAGILRVDRDSALKDCAGGLLRGGGGHAFGWGADFSGASCTENTAQHVQVCISYA